MVLKVSNLSIWYQNHKAPTLKGVNFEVKQGQSLLITGNMGSGKSTLFWAISKLFTPGTLLRSNGSITSDRPLIYISQRIKAQILTFNVREELATRLSFKNVDREKRRELVYELTSKYNLGNLIDRNTRNLSSGQQQLIVILANIIEMRENFIILMDEPLSLLDKKNKKLVISLISDLVNRGNSVIIADPRSNRYSELNPEIQILNNGNLQKEQNLAIHKFSLDLTLPQYFKYKRKISLGIGIGYHSEIQRVETDLPSEGIVLVTGENGSGKTTLLLTLAKIIKPITVYKEFKFPPTLYLPQDTFTFFWRETVEDELLESFSKDEIPRWLDDFLTTSPFLLSEGQRKKLALELCYSSENVLLLDEPTQALDLDSIKWFAEKTIEYAKNNLIVISTNDTEFIELFGKSPVVINFSM
ncbi:MAG: ABC transporter ATP-binding protein [Candidatus Heimdallarchaeota archaeon]|nr:ABC transporter ATP-binding protein [Candidatus Heimdallarchaeota archaeon]